MFASTKLRQLLRFGSVGVFVMLTFMGLNAWLGRWLSAQAAFFAAYPPALVLHFVLNKLWTFRDRRETTARHVAEYVHTVVVTFLIQWPVFTLLQRGLAAPGWLAAGVANLVQMTASFLLMRTRVFGDAGPEAGRAAWHRLLVLLTVIGMALVLYQTTFSGWQAPAVGGRQYDYYNLLVDGLRKGVASLDVDVPEALRTAANPWNPDERPAGVAVLHDASFYQGRYYLYFGVAPVLTLLLPFRLLFGVGLPLSAAVFIFGLGAVLVAAWLWCRILRDHFPAVGLPVKLGGLLALGLADGLLVLARRASLWEMPIAAGHCWMMLLVAASYLALRSRPHARWLVLAGLALGLAVSSRPTLVTAGGGLAVLALVAGWGRAEAEAAARGRVTRWARPVLAAGLPFGAVVAALLAYNYLRFDHLLEFGLNYQLTGNHESKATHFSLGFLPFNTAMYFWSVPQWGRYFPFLHPVAAPPTPAGYYGFEFVYGVLWVCPVVWLAVLLPAWLCRPRSWRCPELAGFTLILVAMAAGTTGLLLCFNTAAARYIADFLPWYVWLAVLAAAGIDRWLTSWRGWRRTWQAAFALAAGFSGFIAFCASVELHGVYEFLNPQEYRAVSRLFNGPVGVWERLSGSESGPVEMDIVFPEKSSGSVEPLLVTGVAYQTDFFYVFYKSNRLVQLGFAKGSGESRQSPDIAVEPGRTYRLRLEGGSLYPPPGHPRFDRWSEAEIAARKRWAVIALDGRMLLKVPVEAHESSPGSWQIGRSERTETYGRRFSGVISKVEVRNPERLPFGGGGTGDFVLQLDFPPPGSTRAQPLLVAGEIGHSDLVTLRRTSPTAFRLGYEAWGAGFWESEEIAVPASESATLRIRLGSVLPPDVAEPLRVLRNGVAVWMDGRLLWWHRREGVIGASPRVQVAVNDVGSSVASRYFDGWLSAWERLPGPPTWIPGPFGAVELVFGSSDAGTDPLLTTGTTGQADTVAIERLADGRGRIIYDHWGQPLTAGEPFAWTPGTHRVRIESPVLPRLDADLASGPGRGRLRVILDGTLVCDMTVAYFPAASASVAVGRNETGGSVAGGELRGVVLEAIQIPVAP